MTGSDDVARVHERLDRLVEASAERTATMAALKDELHGLRLDQEKHHNEVGELKDIVTSLSTKISMLEQPMLQFKAIRLMLVGGAVVVGGVLTAVGWVLDHMSAVAQHLRITGP